MNRIVILFSGVALAFSTQVLKGGPNVMSWLEIGNVRSNSPLFFRNASGPTVLAPAGTFVQVLARSDATGGEFIQLPKENPEVYVVGEFFGFEGFWGSDVIDVDYLVQGDDQPMADFIVRAWRGADAWEAAINDPNAFIGQSGIFTRELNPAFPITTNQEPVDLAPPSFTVVPVPEPSVTGLLGVGVLSLSAFRLLRSRSPDGRAVAP